MAHGSGRSADQSAGQMADHQHDRAAMDMAGPTDAPPPPVPTDHAGDRIFSPQHMAAARQAMNAEMQVTTGAVIIDRLEYRAGRNGDEIGWDGTAWYGGDINRAVLASEGDRAVASKSGRAEASAYWRRALDPWFNLQLGVRQDLGPGSHRSYALIGIEGLAPYWFDVDAQLFVSTQGDVHARTKASYQQRITQSLVLEPEMEVDFAFQDVPAIQMASGFERMELGTRLRYERNRAFAPYVGVHWERRLGDTARLTRTAGDRASGVSGVVGVRAMF